MLIFVKLAFLALIFALAADRLAAGLGLPSNPCIAAGALFGALWALGSD